MLALGAAAAAQAETGRTGDPPLAGFTAQHSAAELRAEQRFRGAVSAERAGSLSRALSGRPQLIGTAGLAQSRALSLATLRSYGLDARTSRRAARRPSAGR